VRGNICVSFRRDRGDTGSRHASVMLIFTVRGSVFMPVTKVPCGPKETAILHDWWLVVVIVVV
jgi:hypothetical protein